MQSPSFLIIALLILFSLFVPLHAQSCTSNADCNYQGLCLKTESDGYMCRCDSQYATQFDNQTCLYERKKQSIAFALQFCLGWCGAGFFYIGRTDLGLGTILVLALLIPLGILACIATVCLSVDRKNNNSSAENRDVVILNVFWCLAISVVIEVIVCWIVGVFYFGLNAMPDSNNICLQPW